MAAVAAGHTIIDTGELQSDEMQRLLNNDRLQQTFYDLELDDFYGNLGNSTTM